MPELAFTMNMRRKKNGTHVKTLRQTQSPAFLVRWDGSLQIASGAYAVELDAEATEQLRIALNTPQE